VSVELSRPRLRPANSTLLYGALLVNGEIALVLLYYAIASATPTDLLFHVYPLVWINAAIWGVARVDIPETSRRQRWLAVGVAVAYFLLLGGLGGLYKVGGAGLGFRLSWLPPGWGPTAIYSGTALTFSLFPYKVVGYAGLAYLVAVTVLDTAKTGLAGLVGLFSCVSCTWPLAAMLFTGLFGSASAVAAVAENTPYALSTVVFVASVLLLVWRPGR
jgi:hypothetical protein